jgi:N-acetylglutamate synthase-like GNAT family acetyltransferase
LNKFLFGSARVGISPDVSTQEEEVFTVRAARHDDCGAILECLGLAFAPYRNAYTPEAFLDTVLTAETLLIRMAQMSIFVATRESGEIVGTIACKVMEGGRGHLRGMAVRPQWQGSGVSTALLKRAEEELCNSGCSTITLNATEPLKRASHFYQRHGFRSTGNIGSFFGMKLFEYSKSFWTEPQRRIR